jgi:hypothetical protein
MWRRPAAAVRRQTASSGGGEVNGAAGEGLLRCGGGRLRSRLKLGDPVMLLTGVNGGVMMAFVFMVGDMVMLVIGINGSAMVVNGFVVDDMLMLVMSEIRSPCCHIGEARRLSSLIDFCGS